MNQGILSTPNFSTSTNLVGIKPLLGVPQVIPTIYQRTTDAIIGNSNGEGKDFVMVVDTSKAGSTTISITLNISPNGGLIELVDWGDGSNGALIPSSVGTTAFPKAGSFETRFVPGIGGSFVITHTYAKHGVYIVTIRGTIGSMGYVSNIIPHAGAATTAILSYGKLNIASLNHTAMTNLTYIPPYLEKGIAAPGAGAYPDIVSSFDSMNIKIDNNITYWDTSNVRDMRYAFRNCKNIVVNGNWNWNTTGVINFSSMFDGASLRNITFSGWVFNGTTANMFANADFDNCNLINWSGSNASTMFSAGNGRAMTNCIISGWRITSNITNMFYSLSYRIGGNNYFPSWDLRGCTDATNMFYGNYFRCSGFDDWNVSGVTNMTTMFYAGSDFMIANLSNWDISKVTNFTNFMSRGTTAPSGSITINNWNISSGCNCTNMFADASKNFVSLSGWKFLGNNDCTRMFGAVNFTAAQNNTFSGVNIGLETWDTSGITNMAYMFYNQLNFNANISGWNTSNVVDMNNMFATFGAVPMSFNKNLENWDTSKVTNMNSMFYNASYVTGPKNWNVSKVTDFSSMFRSANVIMVYNENLSGWNTASAITMSSMFNNTFSFRGNGIDNWNVTGVQSINSMFRNFNTSTPSLAFNLSGWNLCNCTDMINFMINRNISSGNYDILLNSWEKSSTGNPIKPWATGINVHFGNSKYTAASSGARQRLINYGWTITDGGFQA